MSSTLPSRYLYICGDKSGVGKSSVSLLLLHSLLSRGFPPGLLSYIKPATQCEDIQLISLFCTRYGVHFNPIGPLLFYAGFTKEVIEEMEKGPEEVAKQRAKRLHDIVEAIESVGITTPNNKNAALNKIETVKYTLHASNSHIFPSSSPPTYRITIIDGVGYPSVGSFCGITSADIVNALDIPVLIVGRGGIGNSIDAFNFILDYFTAHPPSSSSSSSASSSSSPSASSLPVIGGVFNKIPASIGYHTFDSSKEWVTRYFHAKWGKPNADNDTPSICCFGFIPDAESDEDKRSARDEEKVSSGVCALNNPRDLVWNDDVEAKVKLLIDGWEKEFEWSLFWKRLTKFWEEKQKNPGAGA